MFHKCVNSKKLEQYAVDLDTAIQTMISGATDAEEVGNLTLAVWYNVIFQRHDETTDPYTLKNGKFYDDFNDALAVLFADEDYISKVEGIGENRLEVKELMEALKNPPSRYEEVYSGLRECYDAYYELISVVLLHNGSYNSFSEDFQKADSATVKAFQDIVLYVKES